MPIGSPVYVLLEDDRVYYDRMIRNSNKDFSDVVSAGEMIEAGVKQGKIEVAEAKKQFPKKKGINPRDNLSRKSL